MPAKRHYTSYTKDELQNSRAWELQLKSIESILFLTHLKYDTESPEHNYISCKHCGGRFVELRAHLKKFHNQTTDEYKKQFSGALVVAPVKANKIAGENNPGYQHGGKLSAYSDKFVKYEGKTKQEIETEKQDVIVRATQTRQDNPERQPTRIEYYLAKGMTETEAKMELSKRQSTFSIDSCRKKFGDTVGEIVWQIRQDNWRKTLDSKTLQEKEDIQRRLAPKRYYHHAILEKMNSTNGLFYLIKISDNLYKYGITYKSSIKDRYDNISMSRYQEIYVLNNINMNTCFMIEQVMKSKYKNNVIKKDEAIHPFGWTETIRMSPHEVLQFINSTNHLNKNKSILLEEFDSL